MTACDLCGSRDSDPGFIRTCRCCDDPATSVCADCAICEACRYDDEQDGIDRRTDERYAAWKDRGL